MLGGTLPSCKYARTRFFGELGYNLGAMEEATVRFEDKTVIVTGAGRNIGEGIAHAFANEGARVAVVDVIGERAASVAAAINADHSAAALGIACDVTAGEPVRAMLAQVVEAWGGVDVLINNVGVVDRQSILEVSEEEWDRVIRISLRSVFVTTKYVALRMAEQARGGAIVNIGSTSGHRARSNATAYPAAKGGVLNLTRSLAAQLGPHGIRVNSITPNRVLTEAEPGAPARATQVDNLVGRQVRPMDVASAAVFLASDEADAITGTDLAVDGGVLAI
mgnify:CR=1 FL=1